MGCGGSKPADSAATPVDAPVMPKEEKSKKDLPPCGPVEEKIRSHPQVTLGKDGYYGLSQSFAIIRHGDRLDHTPAWKTSPLREKWPNDTPLTDEGHKHATEVGKQLAKSGKEFGLIISSPYYRCVQTASRIAQELKLPIHLDLDLGEVFDNVSMKGHNLKDHPQHRKPDDLEAALKEHFLSIPEPCEYVRDDNGKIKVEGKLQRFPENFDAARMRYCYKVKKLVQRAAAELMSIVIVTHGDALAAVVGLLREDWKIMDVPYTANAICSRKVKVLKKDTEEQLMEESVYVHPDEWELKLSTGFKYQKIPRDQQQEAHVQHMVQMQQMNAQANTIKTDYVLDDDQTHHMRDALNHLEAHDSDTAHLLNKAASSHHLAQDKSNRILCSPHSKEN
jgi:broad specificity phosphatase PhoE